MRLGVPNPPCKEWPTLKTRVVRNNLRITSEAHYLCIIRTTWHPTSPLKAPSLSISSLPIVNKTHSQPCRRSMSILNRSGSWWVPSGRLIVLISLKSGCRLTQTRQAKINTSQTSNLLETMSNIKQPIKVIKALFWKIIPISQSNFRAFSAQRGNLLPSWSLW